MLVSELPKNIAARANRTIDQYHRNIKKLHTSDYAETILGSTGGKETKDWPYKGSMRKFPRVYKNSGAIVEKKSGKWIITLFSHLGKKVDTIPLIPDNSGKDDYCESFGALY